MFLPVLCLCCGVFFFAPVFLALFPVCVLCDAKSVKMLNIHNKTRQPNKARKRGSLTLEQTQQYAENEGRWPCVMKFDAFWGVCFVSDDRCGAPCGFVGRSGSGGCFVVSCVFVPAAVRVVLRVASLSLVVLRFAEFVFALAAEVCGGFFFGAWSWSFSCLSAGGCSLLGR